MEFTSTYTYAGHEFVLEIEYGKIKVLIDGKFSGQYENTKIAISETKKAIDVINESSK